MVIRFPILRAARWRPHPLLRIAAIAALAAAVAAPAVAAPAVAAAAAATDADMTAPSPSVGALPPLPEGVASFGGAVLGDALYVYGGHVGKTHVHTVENLFHRFLRLDLADPGRGWQDLGTVRGLQGLALVAVGGRVCRIGGLEARNRPGDDEDLVSTDEVACFDPDAGTWHDLPPLPAPRSSHDAAVVGERIYAIGGWRLRGAGSEPAWHDTVAVLDLAAARPAWREVAQPFRRRALAAAAADGALVAFGGIGTDGTSRRVDRFDLAAETWTRGPELPAMAGRIKGFGVSAFGVGDRIYLSGGDGVVHALLGDRWLEHLGTLATPRFFHRLLPHRDRLLFVAGAGSGGHLADVESIALADLEAPDAIPSTAGAARPASGSPAARW